MTLLTAAPVRFDADLGLWLVTRHRDVEEALASEDLGIAGGSDPSARAAVARTAVTSGSPAPERLRALAEERLAGLPREARTLDWARDVARPWSLDVVAELTGMRPDRVAALDPVAAGAFQAAAHASHPTPSATHREAVAALAQALPRDVEPQAFVALTQSLPALLATAWSHLVRDSRSWTHARAHTPLTTARVDELLRVGSPVEVLFRTATRDTEVAGTRLPAGAIVAVGIGAAHRDRDAHGAVLTFGRARHGCPGAGLIRSLLRVATTTLLEAFPQARPAAGAAYGGGFALRYVANLPVSVGRPRAPTTTCTGR